MEENWGYLNLDFEMYCYKNVLIGINILSFYIFLFLFFIVK